MITDEMLREAAAKTSAAYLRYVEQGYDPENQHVFSPEFEKKMEKLIRKTRNIFLHQTLRRIASVALAVLIGVSAWLAVDIEAKAAFFGWIKGIYETYFVYQFEDDTTSNADFHADYRPTWLPDGYSEFFFDDSTETILVAYTNDAGKILSFNYINNPNETKWLVDLSQASISETTVNGTQAKLFIATNVDTASAIAWTTPDHTAFYISAFLSENDLIKIAESVRKIQN